MSATTGDTIERDAAILAGVCSAAELRESLCLWKKADAAVATSQSYTLAGRALTRADAPEIRTNILLYARAVAMAEANAAGRSVGGSRFVPARFLGGLADHG